MRHDVQRLDRLITDISDASRLDSELARESRRPVNIAELLQTLCGAINDVHRDCKAKIDFQIKGVMRAIAMSNKSPFFIQGHEGRLHQVITNILDNAISFSPPDAKIRIACSLIKKDQGGGDHGRGRRVPAFQRRILSASSSASIRTGPGMRNSARIPALA